MGKIIFFFIFVVFVVYYFYISFLDVIEEFWKVVWEIVFVKIGIDLVSFEFY